jgi:hypothetical protein
MVITLIHLFIIFSSSLKTVVIPKIETKCQQYKCISLYVITSYENDGTTKPHQDTRRKDDWQNIFVVLRVASWFLFIMPGERTLMFTPLEIPVPRTALSANPPMSVLSNAKADRDLLGTKALGHKSRFSYPELTLFKKF